MKKLIVPILLLGAAVSAFAQISDEAFFRLCATGTVDNVRNAAAAGANINAWGEIKDADGFTSYYTCLMIACKNENVEVVDFLLDNGAKPNPHSREYPMHYVVNWERSDRATVKRMIQKLHMRGADIDARTTNGLTSLLMCAADPAKEDLGLLLIELGAGVNVRDGEANTPLMVALTSGINNSIQHQLIDKLISLSANTNAKNLLGDRAYTILKKYDKKKSNEITYYSWYWKIQDDYYNANN
ncbi:MAG: ankyrin repeat domain-containing protein [Treponema sp.]|nr:ankyrin repeat domain-containing protein [Treponema sp.]